MRKLIYYYHGIIKRIIYIILYYIIQLPKFGGCMQIYELKSGKKTYSLEYHSGLIDRFFITHNDNDPNQTDYLNVLTESNICVYNLENGHLLKSIYIFHNIKSIGRFIQWNDRSIIFIIDNHLLEILDLKMTFSFVIIIN